MFRDFPTFSRAWIFFLRRLSLFDILSSSLLFSSLLFSSLTLPISAFHLSILSEVWLPNLLHIYIYIADRFKNIERETHTHIYVYLYIDTDIYIYIYTYLRL